MLVWSWKKFVPDLEYHDLQSFPNEEINKSKIDIVCAMRSFENTNNETMKNGYKVVHVN
jgi:hypothetical protein